LLSNSIRKNDASEKRRSLLSTDTRKWRVAFTTT
jgi:hypothetical protein